jgi:hypothetical protein
VHRFANKASSPSRRMLAAPDPLISDGYCSVQCDDPVREELAVTA